MKVKELIEKLLLVNPDATVEVHDRYGEYTSEIRVVKHNGLEHTVLLH